MSAKPIIAVTGATGAQGGGVVDAILADPERRFAVRAVTRHPEGDKGRALAARGVEVVAGDADRPETLVPAFQGAHGVFAVTAFWEHMSAPREYAQAAAIARATGKAGVSHVVWSTLEDTREQFALGTKLPTLAGSYNVPHFDAKGEADAVFEAEGAPTSFLLAAFYWENFIFFGQGPRRGEDGKLVLALPLGGQKLPGIAAADIGGAALGIFRLGTAAVDHRYGIAGDVLTGEEYAASFTRAMGEPVAFRDVPFDVARAYGYPGADDMANMFEYHKLCGTEFLSARSPEVTRSLNPATQSFDKWLAANVKRVPIG